MTHLKLECRRQQQPSKNHMVCACTRLSVSVGYSSRNLLCRSQTACWTVFTEKRETHTYTHTRSISAKLDHCTNIRSKLALFTWTLPRGNQFLCPGRWLDLQKVTQTVSELVSLHIPAHPPPPLSASNHYRAIHPLNEIFSFFCLII